MSEFPSLAPLRPEILSLHAKWRGDRDAVVVAKQLELGLGPKSPLPWAAQR